MNRVASNMKDIVASEERYQLAVHGASESLGASQDEAAGAVFLDVRRAGVFEQADALIAGARWSDGELWGTEGCGRYARLQGPVAARPRSDP